MHLIVLCRKKKERESRNETIFCLGTKLSEEVNELLFMVILFDSIINSCQNKIQTVILVLLFLIMLFQGPAYREKKQ